MWFDYKNSFLWLFQLSYFLIELIYFYFLYRYEKAVISHEDKKIPRGTIRSFFLFSTIYFVGKTVRLWLLKKWTHHEFGWQIEIFFAPKCAFCWSSYQQICDYFTIHLHKRLLLYLPYYIYVHHKICFAISIENIFKC